MNSCVNILFRLQRPLNPSTKHCFCRVAAKNIPDRRFPSRKINEMAEFPPDKVRVIVKEVAALLKERNETISVAETVCCFPLFLASNHKISCLSSLDQGAKLRAMHRELKVVDVIQAAGGILSASLISFPGASGFYKGGLTVCLYPFHQPHSLPSPPSLLSSPFNLTQTTSSTPSNPA